MEKVEDLHEAVVDDTANKGNDSDDNPQEDEDKARKASTTPPEGMSKNQMKKMLKRQRWLEMKSERRAFEKQKKKEKRQAMKESGEPLPVSRKRLKRNSMKNSACKVKVAIDCSFDDLMNEKDICQLVQQLNHGYAANRRVEDPLQFYITSLSGKAKQRMDSLGDYKNWDVYTKTDDYLDVFRKDQVVYLTSESPNVLTTLDTDKAYIIGGLVDHNHQKGLCYRLAQEKGIAHAQLPISDYMELKTRKVLTINHVFEILLEFTRTESWEEAFFKVIPNRKVSHLKGPDKNKTQDVSEDQKRTKGDDKTNVITDDIDTNIKLENCQGAESSSTATHQEAVSTDTGATSAETTTSCTTHQGATQPQDRDCDGTDPH